MPEPMMPTAKVSIAAFSFLVVMTSVFVTATAMRDLMYPYVDVRLKDDASAPEVAGVETEAGQEGMTNVKPKQEARINIEDKHDGTAAIYLNLPSFDRVAALDLSFELSDGIVVTNLVCADGYECTAVVVDFESMRFIAFRAPGSSGELWSGEMKVATLEYDTATDGYLEINGVADRESRVVQNETGANILSPIAEKYPMGM